MTLVVLVRTEVVELVVVDVALIVLVELVDFESIVVDLFVVNVDWVVVDVALIVLDFESIVVGFALEREEIPNGATDCAQLSMLALASVPSAHFEQFDRVAFASLPSLHFVQLPGPETTLRSRHV